MRIEEIESQIATNRNAMRELQNQISGLSIKTSELERLKEDDKLKTFVEYIEVGSTYEFHSYTYLTGVESGSKTGLQSNFIKGDVIEIVKKNKMSIVIKCIKKISSTRDSNNMRVLS
jgi:protein subunit release factor B